jgi:hypothetical protein
MELSGYPLIIYSQSAIACLRFCGTREPDIEMAIDGAPQTQYLVSRCGVWHIC